MITIITGPIRSGKTTYLKQVVDKISDVVGILTPDSSEGKRQLLDLATGRSQLMEASCEEASVSVGRYRFTTVAINAGISILQAALQSDHKTIVVDEIGKLELRGEGWDPVLPELKQWSKKPQHNLIIVVREELAKQVWERYFE